MNAAWTERDVALYRAVTKARGLIRAGMFPTAAAGIACAEGLADERERVKHLAVSAENACEDARVWIRENVK